GPAPNPVDQPAGPGGGIVVEAVRSSEETVGVEAGTDELVEVVDHPPLEHGPVGFGVELQPEVRTGPERLGPGPAAGQLGGAGRDGEGVEVPLQPRPRLDAGRSAVVVHLDGHPADLGVLGATDGPAQRHRQDLTTEAEPEDGDAGTVGGADAVDLGFDTVGDLRTVDRAAGAEQYDVDEVAGIGEGGRTGRVTRPAAHLVHDQPGAQSGERPARVTVTGVGVVV